MHPSWHPNMLHRVTAASFTHAALHAYSVSHTVSNPSHIRWQLDYQTCAPQFTFTADLQVQQVRRSPLLERRPSAQRKKVHVVVPRPADNAPSSAHRLPAIPQFLLHAPRGRDEDQHLFRPRPPFAVHLSRTPCRRVLRDTRSRVRCSRRVSHFWTPVHPRRAVHPPAPRLGGLPCVGALVHLLRRAFRRFH